MREREKVSRARGKQQGKGPVAIAAFEDKTEPEVMGFGSFSKLEKTRYLLLSLQKALPTPQFQPAGTLTFRTLRASIAAP